MLVIAPTISSGISPMKVENTLQVVDARDAYINWNTQQFENLSGVLGEELC